jgi:DNA-binding HxlR family transcriptional regulator
MPTIPDTSCAIARSLGVLGERWTFLILRDAFEGMSRFAEFRASLGVAPDILSDRLSTLVAYGVLRKVDYQEPGERRRAAYQLTDAGRDLYVVLAGLQQWGDEHLPWAEGPSLLRRDKTTGGPVHVGFIDSHGNEVAPENVTFIRTASYPPDRLPARSRPAR